MPRQLNPFMANVDHVVEPVKFDYRAAQHDGPPPKRCSLKLRRAEIGDGEIEPPLRLLKFTLR